MSGVASGHLLLPVAERFIDDTLTPVSAFLKLRRLAPEEPAFLLESAEQGIQVGRWSFIGIKPRAVLRWSLDDGGDPFRLAGDLIAHNAQMELDDPPPFTGGAVGYFGYDLVRTVEPLGEPNPDPLGIPDMALMTTDVIVAFDHLKHTITVIANGEVTGAGEEQARRRAAETIASVRAALAGPLPQLARGAAVPPPRFSSNVSPERFEAMVARIIEYIHAGDAFQVVPSQRFSAALPVAPFSVYRGLRAVNPSPYMYYLDFGDFQLAGASPEPHLRVSGTLASTRPVAGTRPRGETPAADERIAAELLADEKERAEHVMLVDLARNDLGRVCRAGSVSVDSLMSIERYSHVMHIVSAVSGRLREDMDAMEALRATLPAGTLSGAPKVRAMQIIDELEPHKRGGYGGAIGYLSYNGDLDTCIHIRTVLIKDGHAHIQAGGGTVADARPERERAESEAKASAMIHAIELACEQEGWE
ncbi:MAG TPA: anthranilate synthase component I [Solirubrobacteraceae bacterium]|nr:anthranilate synthase component I [Solirubrobacteraceae bacterium]